MTKRLLVALALSVTLAPLARGTADQRKTWRERYESGEYAQAAAILHSLVLELVPTGDVPFPDLDATETLASMYVEGKGVEQEAVVGCSLAHTVVAAAMFRYQSENHPVMLRARRLEAFASRPPLRSSRAGETVPSVKRVAASTRAASARLPRTPTSWCM